jgi:hypothetical protein
MADSLAHWAARVSVVLAVFGSAAVLGALAGAAIQALWADTILILDEAIMAAVALAGAGLWYARFGRHWMTEEEEGPENGRA